MRNYLLLGDLYHVVVISVDSLWLVATHRAEQQDRSCLVNKPNASNIIMQISDQLPGTWARARPGSGWSLPSRSNSASVSVLIPAFALDRLGTAAKEVASEVVRVAVIAAPAQSCTDLPAYPRVVRQGRSANRQG